MISIAPEVRWQRIERFQFLVISNHQMAIKIKMSPSKLSKIFNQKAGISMISNENVILKNWCSWIFEVLWKIWDGDMCHLFPWTSIWHGTEARSRICGARQCHAVDLGSWDFFNWWWNMRENTQKRNPGKWWKIQSRGKKYGGGVVWYEEWSTSTSTNKFSIQMLGRPTMAPHACSQLVGENCSHYVQTTFDLCMLHYTPLLSGTSYTAKSTVVCTMWFERMCCMEKESSTTGRRVLNHQIDL